MELKGLEINPPPPTPHLEDHLCAGHAFHHYFSVAGRCLAEHLGANGGHIQQDGLQRMSVQEELEAQDTPDRVKNVEQPGLQASKVRKC